MIKIDPLASSFFKLFLGRTKVKDIMRTPVITVDQDEDCSAVEEKFVRHQIYYLPVVDSEGKLAGLISHKYLYKAQSPRKMFGEEMSYDPDIIIDGDSFYKKETLDNFILQSIMKKDPFTLGPDNTVAEVVLNMSKRNIGCIPIIHPDRKVVGVITKQTIIDLAAQILKH